MIEIGPPLPRAVVMFALIAKFVPVNTMPANPLVLTTPLKVVVPPPALCRIEVEVIAAAVTLVALVRVNTPQAIDPLSVTLPVPAMIVKFPAPVLLATVMLLPPDAPPLVLSKVALPVSVNAPVLMIPLAEEMVVFPALNTVAPSVMPAEVVVALMVPSTVVVLAVLVNPFVKVRLADPPLFKVTPPVFKNVVAGVTVPPLLKTTLYPCAAVVNAVATVTAPLNVTAPLEFVSVTVGAVVVPVIVEPALLVNVNALTVRLPGIESVPAVPALTVKLCVLDWVTLPEVEMLAPAAVPPAFVVSTAVLPVSVTGPVKVTRPPAVVRLPPRLMAVGAV